MRTLLLTSTALVALLASGVAVAQEPLPDTPVPTDLPPFTIPDFPPADGPEPTAGPYPTAPPPPMAPPPPAYQPTPVPLPPSGSRIFQAPFQSYDPALNAESARLTQVLQLHLMQRGVDLATIDQVPPWPDYSALVYLLACPQGQYPGCALVCGNRVGARWTVGGTVTHGLRGVNANLTFVENRSGLEAIAFGVALHGNNDADLTRAVDVILGKLTSGALAQVDLRRAEVDPMERARVEEARNRVLAESLAELERSEGQMARQDVAVQQAEKLDKETLKAEYAEREEAKPWEKVGLSEGAYVRWKNSDLRLEDWKDLARGRAGALVFRASLAGGSGPFGQYFDGRYAIDDDLERAEAEQFQFVSQAPHVAVDLEAGVGLAPFLDLTAHYAYRNSRFTYLINQERVGAPVVVDRPVGNSYATWQVGGRLNLVPFPVKSVRPTFHLGVAYWKGSSWDLLVQGVQDLEPMKPMDQVLVQVGLGGELTAARNVFLFARLMTDLSVAGQRVERLQVGGASLQERADPSTFQTSNAGVALQGGITFRFRLTRPSETVKEHRPSSRFDEEDI